MNLRELSLKKAYDSDRDDVLAGFFIPALSCSSRYRRLAGFFSSSTLAVAARGISRFVAQNGKMELICGARLSKQDVRAITDAYENPSSALESIIIHEVSDIEDEFTRDHVAALGWMIAHGNLSIKIALVVSRTGGPMTADEVSSTGIFHQKVGILHDAVGNRISFSGSDNETASGWTKHIEEFKVFREWMPEEREYLLADVDKFERFWNSEGVKTIVIDAPAAINERLVQYAPTDFADLDLEKWSGSRGPPKTRPRKLWPHQIEAVENWTKNGRMGILEMATGTGKTITALQALRDTINVEGALLAVVSCPMIHLSKQWMEVLQSTDVEANVVIADSSNRDWRSELADAILDMRRASLIGAETKSVIALTTHTTLGSDAFTEIVKSSKTKSLLIADEVHGIGAPERRKGLIDEYSFRLGLSATPRRWFDEEGTKTVFDYFGNTVYELGLRDAISTINPETGKPYLTRYFYYPMFVTMTSDEMHEYEQITQRIAKEYHRSKTQTEREQYLELLYFERQRILNKAEKKYDALGQILKDISPVEYCLIYCSDTTQMRRVQDILSEDNIVNHSFTQEEGIVPKDEYRGLSERSYLLREFADANYKALVAINCLDEGVDVPPARIGVLMCSSGNPRQFIQRRGRILRQSPGKESARIFDIIVIPDIDHLANDPDISNLEKKIVSGELKRYKEFAKDAWNSVECMKIVHNLERRMSIKSGG